MKEKEEEGSWRRDPGGSLIDINLEL